jgi:hypothetical protein
MADLYLNSAIVLTWAAPSDSMVTGYQILRRLPRQHQNTLLVYVANTGFATTTYTDRDVATGDLYVYRVKAINDDGTGPQSNFVNVEPQHHPDPVEPDVTADLPNALAGLYTKSRKKNGCPRSGAMQPVAGAGRIFTVRSIAYVHTTGRSASNRIRVDSGARGARGHHSPRCDGLGHPALGTQPCRQH